MKKLSALFLLWSATGLTFLITDPPTLFLHYLILFIFVLDNFNLLYAN